ncbi:hypothetical protein BKA62DRAFT_681222 [Auriculariales sp. MPI-PUGE-AT-0066]|nr:hypothetical protein BKA62DRAFT_681222 [Auriculariales sp. MPI-PUGE-AT-0066]
MAKFHEISAHFGAVQTSVEDKVAVYLASMRDAEPVASGSCFDADNASSSGEPECTDEDCLCMLSRDGLWEVASASGGSTFRSANRTIEMRGVVPFPSSPAADPTHKKFGCSIDTSPVRLQSLSTPQPKVREDSNVVYDVEDDRIVAVSHERGNSPTLVADCTGPIPEDSQTEISLPHRSALHRLFCIQPRSKPKKAQSQGQPRTQRWYSRILQVVALPRHNAFRR